MIRLGNGASGAWWLDTDGDGFWVLVRVQPLPSPSQAPPKPRQQVVGRWPSIREAAADPAVPRDVRQDLRELADAIEVVTNAADELPAGTTG